MKTVKKNIEFVLFLFYKYYAEGKGTQDIPYFSAVTIFLAILFMNLVTVFRLFGAGVPLPFSSSDPTWLQYLKSAIGFALPGYLFINLVFPKQRIKNLSYSGHMIDRGNIVLLTYCAISFVVMMLVVMLKN